MTERQIRTLLDGGSFFEGPRWHEGRCIPRRATDGAVSEGLNVFACMLGGEDGRTLLMCAAPDFFEQAQSAANEAVLLTTMVDVPRAGLP
jgi:hypothetical protein